LKNPKRIFINPDLGNRLKVERSECLSSDERSQPVKILQICARIVVRRFEDERSVRQLWMLRKATQGFCADVALADVPVSIDS